MEHAPDLELFLDQLMRDLRVSEGLNLEITRVEPAGEWIEGESDPAREIVAVGGTVKAFSVDSMNELRVEIADTYQDEVISFLGRAWPRCPHHEHPMTPKTEAGAAVWSCPILAHSETIGALAGDVTLWKAEPPLRSE